MFESQHLEDSHVKSVPQVSQWYYIQCVWIVMECFYTCRWKRGVHMIWVSRSSLWSMPWLTLQWWSLTWWNIHVWLLSPGPSNTFNKYTCIWIFFVKEYLVQSRIFKQVHVCHEICSLKHKTHNKKLWQLISLAYFLVMHA